LNINLENLFKVKECKHLSKGIMIAAENESIISVGGLRIQQGKIFNTVLKIR